MTGAGCYRFSGALTVFQEFRLPEPAIPAGYAALIDALGLKVPLPRHLHAIGARHRILRRDGWTIYTPRHAPAPTLEGQLTFALKYEGLDLAVLKATFLTTGPEAIVSLIRAKPTGAYSRRLWFLYEWLTGTRLALPDARTTKTYTHALDESLQFGGAPTDSPRHRVRNNLPGTPAFCPLVFKTGPLTELVELNLQEQANRAAAAIPRDVLARAAAFLLLKDSRSSYAIEGERPPRDRMQRWGRAIGEAGRKSLDLEELLRLQRIVIGDERFVKLGLRREGGFVGQHDRETGAPLPDHIDARPQDLPALVAGLLDFERGAARAMDAVVAAAILAFGFVYVHPFEDGNGRLHRFLIHHMLAARGFNPPGVVFPVSAAILRNVAAYRDALESYSKRLLPLIEWEATAKGNVDVRNDTADFYRYFDATPQAEFLYQCVRETITRDLPHEAASLRAYDRFCEQAQVVADMPDKTVDLLFRFLRQNEGKLSRRAREGEFRQLTPAEVVTVETIYQDCFGQLTTFDDDPAADEP